MGETIRCVVVSNKFLACIYVQLKSQVTSSTISYEHSSFSFLFSPFFTNKTSLIFNHENTYNNKRVDEIEKANRPLSAEEVYFSQQNSIDGIDANEQKIKMFAKYNIFTQSANACLRGLISESLFRFHPLPSDRTFLQFAGPISLLNQSAIPINANQKQQ